MGKNQGEVYICFINKVNFLRILILLRSYFLIKDGINTNMNISVEIPGLKEDEVKLLLAIKLFEEELVSLGKASEISGYSEKTFAEILLRKGISPLKCLILI